MSGDTGKSAGSRLLCLGLGYTARALAHRLARRGFAIDGSARTSEGAAAITAVGWQGHVLDGGRQSPRLDAALATASHLLISAPPEAAGDPVLLALGPAIAAAPSLGWIGYLSTVGVYGDHQGAWIDETTMPRDPGPRGQRRLAAEAGWLDLGARSGKRVEIFRLPGIYGPGRSAIDQVLAGTARRIIKPGQVFNRMHVDDIAGALEAALSGPARYQVYNLVDDEPAPPQDVLAFAAMLLGAPVPPAIDFEEARLTPMAASFYAESKRASNRRMKEALGYRPAYPTYREGLRAIEAATGRST